MEKRREKQPAIEKGDKVLIISGSMSGTWNVLAARWAKEDERDDRVEIVIGRGSLNAKINFNPKTMRHIENTPAHILRREIRVPRPLRLKQD